MGPDPVLQARIEASSREALAHLRAGRADAARPLVDELSPLLAARPDLLAQMRQALEVVGFEWPAERRDVVLAPVDPPAPAALDLVAFHVALPVNPSGVHGAVDYGAALAACFASARLRAPEAGRILLTDGRTALPDLGDARVLRMPMDARYPMFERMRLQERFLAERPAGRATVFMDSDVMTLAEPSPVFAEDFDVGLTWREGAAPEAPFNGGMIFANRGEAARRFLARALDGYEALAASPRVAPLYPGDLRAWWGDQFALAAHVGYRAFAGRRGEAIEVDGARVRFFPCDTHNLTIGARPPPREQLRGTWFAHFKGQRKGMQAAFLDAMRRGDV